MGDDDAAAATGGKPERLVERLQKQLDRLQKVQFAAPNSELEAALRDLREDVENLKIMAPHVYSPPLKKNF